MTETALCSWCNLVKPLSEMFHRKTRTGVSCTCCIACNKRRRAGYFNKNRAARLTKMREYHSKKVAEAGGRVRRRGDTKWEGIRAFFAWLKGALPCTDCGNSFHFSVIDFDHVRGEKLFNIASVMGMAVTDEQLWEEVQKCEPVCSNCHRLRTWNRKHGILSSVVQPAVT